jgi:Flp pilus assembly protein TadD
MIGMALAGCALDQVRNETAVTPPTSGACPKLDAAVEVQLGLVRQMLDQDRAYAGLAHLAALDPAVQASAQARYLQAELLRHTGRAQEAETYYKGLLGSCVAGYGHHGLGLLAAEQDLPQAIVELHEAARYWPTDPRVRNDLGYALLLADDVPAARREFMTAVELGDYKQRASLNLVLLMLYAGDDQGAGELGRQLKLSEGELERLRRRALDMRAALKTEPKKES